MPSSGLKTLPKVAMVEGEVAMVEGEVAMGEAEGRILEEVEVDLIKPEDEEGARRG